MATCVVLDLTEYFTFNASKMFANTTNPGQFYFEMEGIDASARVAQYMSGIEQKVLSPDHILNSPNDLKGFIFILFLTLLINLLIMFYFWGTLKIRVMTDLCELLALLVLGHNSPPDRLFKSFIQHGVSTEDYDRTWVVEPRDGNIMVVSKDEKEAVELEKRHDFWMRSWDVWRPENPLLRFRKRHYAPVDESPAPGPPLASPWTDSDI
ncbi:hypothetical protein E8E11_009684 [Didymella keratinophila]|nr:hypothetical protein E8E11_009684 [Didymella keratinophila]